MKKLKILTLSLTLLLPLAGCEAANSKDQWNLTAEDLDSAIVLPTPEHKTDYEKQTITYKFHLPDENILGNRIENDDVLVWDKTVLGSTEGTEKGYKGATLISAKIANTFNVSNADGAKDKVLEIVTPLTVTHQPSVIIDKDASPLGQYVIAHDLQPNNPAFGMDIKDYSSKIIDQDFDDAGKVAKGIIDFSMSIAMIIVGIASESPSSVVSGISSLLNTMFGLFNTEVTNAQLLAEIKVIQQQLKEVIAKLDDIKNALEALQIITQCGFDQAKLTTIEGNWNAFIADYYDPANSRLNEFGQTFATYLGTFVQKPQTIAVKYAKDENNEYRLLAPFEDDYGNPAHTINLEVTAFPETKKFLNYGALKTGFLDGLLKDIEAVVPENAIKDKTAIAVDAYNEIANTFAANEYFSTEINSAKYKNDIDIVNRVGDFADHISGDYFGGTSILNAAYERLTLMYNFAGEVVPIWTNFLATLKCYLTYFGQFAQTAALNSHIAQDTLNEKLIKASDKIKEYYHQTKDLAKNFAYIAGSKIETKIGETGVDTRVTGGNKNHPTISDTFFHKTVDPYDLVPDAVTKETLDWSKVTTLDNVAIQRISNRYSGIHGTKNPDKTFIAYLVENDALTWRRAFFPEQKGWLANFYEGFITGIALNDMNEGTALRCVWRSNGDYFKVGNDYTYRLNKGSIESQYWGNGKIMTGSFVNAMTGKGTFNGTLTGYARYWESHALWFNDEIWGFTTKEPLSHYWYIQVV